jgi:GTP-binding protein
MMCNRKNLAKTSSTPGKTRLINFFRLRIEPAGVQLHLVDLPGYGYAKASKTLQAEWSRALEEFLQKRELQGILHLIDSRHEPTVLDRQMRAWIVHQRLPAITALTKVDKLKQNAIAKSRKMICTELQIQNNEPCILTSVLKKSGIQELLQAIVCLAEARDADKGMLE